jgi:NitT/TauT family transport system substrate-binding protein
LVLKKVFLTIIAITAIGAIITALFIYTTPKAPSNQKQLEPVSVGAEFSQVNTLLFVAENMNYFSDKGLDVTLKPYSSGAEALNGMINGEVDIAASSEFSVVNKVLENSSVSIFGTIDRFQQICIVTFRDTRIQDITDLANKSVGLTAGTSAEFFFGRLLELNNINLSHVKRVNMPPNNIVDALINGTVDAVVTWQPYINQIKDVMADDVVEWPAQSGQQIYCSISATNNWIDSHKETLTRFLEAIAQAENYLESNPTNVKDLVKNHLNFTSEHLESVWPDHFFKLSLDQSLILIMEDEARWLIMNNLTSTTIMPNLQDFIYHQSLAQVKPNSVTVVG